MNLDFLLSERSQGQCELCASTTNLATYLLPPTLSQDAKNAIWACDTCRNLMQDNTNSNPNHWRCLSESMWSEHLPVQVTAYRILKNLNTLDWAQSLFSQLYLDEEALQWAESTMSKAQATDHNNTTKDSNGAILVDGDSVTLIKDLDVKGANFTAKRGTVVKNITLTSNPAHIEGRVNGTQIVLLTCFLKKAN